MAPIVRLYEDVPSRLFWSDAFILGFLGATAGYYAVLEGGKFTKEELSYIVQDALDRICPGEGGLFIAAADRLLADPAFTQGARAAEIITAHTHGLRSMNQAPEVVAAAERARALAPYFDARGVSSHRQRVGIMLNQMLLDSVIRQRLGPL